MTLNELKYIVAVARAKHFGRAAEACFISQPTLSVAVRKLERELDVELFERRQGEVTVTPVGEQVVAQAQRILEEAGMIKEIVAQGRDQLAAPLRVGAIYTIGPYLFPHLVTELSERAPDMPLIIEENYTHVLAEKLKQGEVDAILISLPFEEHGILTVPLYEESFVVLLPGSHALNQKDRLTVEEISQEQVLLLGAGHCFRDQVLELCPECIHKRNRVQNQLVSNLEGGSLETIRYMVASGIGITILPCSAAGADRFSQRLVSIKRFKDANPCRQVALAWRKSFPRPQAIDVLREAVGASKLSCIKHL